MAVYKSEMLSFGYAASLHIDHPTLQLDEVSQRLGITARSMHRAGEERRTPKKGTYPTNHWSCDLPTEDQQDLTDFLGNIVSKLKPNRDFLRELAETGGEVCVFIGVGSSRCCAHQFDRELLHDLADTGIDLRIDFYGSELPQRGLHPDQDEVA